MKTVEINIYRIEELSEVAQKIAFNTWLNNTEPYLDEFDSSYDTFCHYMNITHDFRGVKFNISDDALSLTGHRLYAWIQNNMECMLYDRKYIKRSKRAEPHPMRIIKNKFVSYKSNIFFDGENTYTMTGAWTDTFMLNPFYAFLKSPDNKTTLCSLIDEAIVAIEKGKQDEYSYQTSMEYFIEECESCDKWFLEDGIEYKTNI